MKTEENNKKALILSLIYVLAAFFAYKIFSVLTENLTINYYVLQVLKESVFFAIALFTAFKLNKLDTLRWKRKGFGSGFIVGIYFIIIAVLSYAVGILRVIYSSDGLTLRVWEIILLFVYMILIGLSEELLFRGVLQNCFHDFWGENSVGAVRKSILCTGLVFAFIHIFNIFTGSSVIGTLAQVIQVFPLGLLFATIYYRSHKNLWVCILLHAVYDGGGFIGSGALLGVKTSEVISGYNLKNSMIMAVIILLIVLFVTRKKKLQKCIDTI